MNGGVGVASYANNSLLKLGDYIADLGCSSGPHTLFVVNEFIKIVEKLCRELNHKSPEYNKQVFLNDFNNIFKSLDNFKEKLCDGMKGGIGCNIYIGTTSPSNVVRAYYEQFQRDFSLSLKCRAEEIVEGGHMIPTFLGRRSDDPSSKDEVSEVNWNAFDDWNALEFESERSDTLSDGGYNVAQCMRAVAEPMLASHFGEAIIEEVFSRYQQSLTDRMPKEQTKFINVTVLLTRKA
ncbi:hypothetical protein AAZX31_16G121000 [Glycine max]